MIASTTAEDAYAALKRPGLLNGYSSVNQQQFHTPRMDVHNSLDHRPSRERSRITATDQHPRRRRDRDFVATRERQFDVFREVFQIIDRLLQCQDTQALDTEIRERIRDAEEAVLQDDGRSVFLLGNLPIDRPVRQIASVCCKSDTGTSMAVVVSDETVGY